METVDDETSAAAIDFMKRQHAAGKPFFVWFNSTRMHLRTHVRKEHRGLANGIKYTVHLDGYDHSEFLRKVRGTAVKNNSTKSARNLFFYADDDGLLVGARIGDYKYVFAEQRAPGTMEVWAEPFTVLRLQKIYNLFQDPHELKGEKLLAGKAASAGAGAGAKK